MIRFQIQYLSYDGTPAVYSILASNKQDAMQRFQTRIIDWSEILDISPEEYVDQKSGQKVIKVNV